MRVRSTDAGSLVRGVSTRIAPPTIWLASLRWLASLAGSSSEQRAIAVGPVMSRAEGRGVGGLVGSALLGVVEPGGAVDRGAGSEPNHPA